jgi:hypothetical protein
MATSHYELRVRGRLGDPVLARFDTILHGPILVPIRDQVEFHGALERVRSLGLELLEVRRLPD